MFRLLWYTLAFLIINLICRNSVIINNISFSNNNKFDLLETHSLISDFPILQAAE